MSDPIHGSFRSNRGGGRRSGKNEAVVDRLRIPVKSAADSETKPATYSDFMPATIPI